MTGRRDVQTAAHRISRATPASTAGLGVSAAAVGALATLPLWDADGALQATLVTILVYLSLAQMWNLLAGFAGLMSIGQQMFVGVGIYALLTIAETGGSTPTSPSRWRGWWRPRCRCPSSCSP